MKKTLFFMIITLFLSPSSAADYPTGMMEITVSKISKEKGNIMLALHDRSNTYLARDKSSVPFRDQMEPVSGQNSVVITFDQVPYGEYAIAIFHDVNRNGELDTNFLGIPKEPYGFSNNLRKMLPPSFEEAKFEFGPTTEKITVNLK